MILKKTQITLERTDEKTTKQIPFDVPDGMKKLAIAYSYSPKILEDKEKSVELIKENIIRDGGEEVESYKDYEQFMPLKNLVTLSLFSPEGFRGAAHRQAESQLHEISEEAASYGFLKGKIPKGQWGLCLNVHAIVTESCNCIIEIEGEGEG